MAANGQKRTAGAVLVQPVSQGSQHATAYLKSFWLIAYTYIPIGHLSSSVNIEKSLVVGIAGGLLPTLVGLILIPV